MKFKILNFTFLILILIISTFILELNLSWGYIIISILIWLSIVFFGSFNIQWNFFLRSISKGITEKNQIALTFDDGPHPEFTPKVLGILEKYNAKATFFCIGKNVKANPETVQLIYQKKHSIGNHSFTHSSKIDFSSKKRWLYEIYETDYEIEKITKQKTNLFRPPFGVTTPHLAAALSFSNHLCIGWNIRSFDTLQNQNPRDVVKRILNQTSPGSIILLHDHLQNIIPILEQLLPELQKRNFTFVTVDELINSKPYETIPL